jgi:phage regulator Rha-like protein
VNELVLLKHGDAFTDSMKIAQGTGNKHHAVQQIQKKYKITVDI